MEGVAGVAIATSPTTIAYVTTETGAATIMVLIAGYLLTRRASDFSKAQPEDGRSTPPPQAGVTAVTNAPS